MKRSTKHVLGLAVGGVVLSGGLYSQAPAATQTWNSTTSQNWLTAANWSGNAIPGSGDTALFNISPPSNTVDVNSSASVGAIFAEYSGNTNLSVAGGGTLTLYGQTLTVPQFSGTLTSEPNVVLAFGDGGASAQTNTLTVGNNILLNGAQNVMVGSAFNNLNNNGQTIILNGNIANAGATAAQLTLLGGGTTGDYGAEFELNGTNTFTGGMVIGNSSATEGAEVQVTPSALPTTGTIVVNEQSQLLLDGSGTYGAGTTLDLNGPGVGPGVSEGSSGALRTSGKTNTYTYAGTVNIGTDTSGSDAAPYVVISSTSSNSLTFSGQVTGNGSIQKQGSGWLIFTNTGNTWNGALQIGNGAINVNAGSSMGTGNLEFLQTSTNDTTVNLFNAAQTIGNLSSAFTLTAGSATQILYLNGTALTINQTSNTTFGYGSVVGLTSTISDGTQTGGGSVIYAGASGAQLSLTGPNTYSGGTTINSGILNLANGYNGGSFGVNGSALGSGNVVVNSGGTLASGGNISVLGEPVTTGGFSGNLTVNSGGIVAPGGIDQLGSMVVGGNLTAHSGSIFDFDLAGGTTATASDLTVDGNLALDVGGDEIVNVAGSQLAYGAYTLATFGSLVNSGTDFTLGSTPDGHDRIYSLSTTSSALVLNITDTGREYVWSVGGGDPPVDGSGTWEANSASNENWILTNPAQTQQQYSNSSTNDVIFGNGGNGGTVTLGGAVVVGGSLIFASANSPYTIGAPGGTNSLQLDGGINASASGAINAPVILNGAQTFTAASGTTLTVNGNISESSGGTTLTIGGNTGTVILNGVNSYSGGTVISEGTLQTTTSSMPATGAITDDASLVFSQSTNGTYSGQISGNGAVSVDSPSSTTTVTLGNASNSYSGATDIESGVLSVGSTGALGTGAGGINLEGGTLQFTAAVNFPLGSPIQQIDLVSGNSTIDTDGNNVTMGQDLVGAGNLTKIGNGTLTMTGLIPTTIIGQVSVMGGSLEFDPAGGGATYGFYGSSTTGTFTGDLLLNGSLALRLYGGAPGSPVYINGGGNIQFLESSLSFTSEGTVEVDNQMVLNPNNQPNFVEDIGATSGNSLTITSAITGNSDVDFTNGAGDIYLQGQSFYTGNTTIDNSAGGEVQLDVNNALPTTSNVHLTSSGLLDVYGVSQTIGSLDSGGPGTLAEVTNNSNNNGILIIGGSKSTNFAGYITDSSSAGGGALTIELGSSYTGTLNLNSTTFNSYAGGTILNGGTLEASADDLLGEETGGLTFGGGTLLWTPNSGAITTSRPITVNPGNSTIDVGAGNTFAISGSPSLTWAGGTLNLTDSASPISLAQTGGVVSVTEGSVLAISSTASLAVTGSVDPFTDSSNPNHHVAIANNGSMSVAGVNVSISGITGSGALTIGSDVTLQLATDSGGSSQGSLVIGPNAALDITNNHLILSDPNGTIDATIEDYLAAGYNGGHWNGASATGSIITSASTGTTYGIGWADGATGGISGISSGQLEIKYTLYGDTNLDGVVTGVDFGNLAANFGKSGPSIGWAQGAFTYNNSVTGVDFGLLAGNFGKSLGSNGDVATAADWAALDAFAQANGLMSYVPEPASASLILLVEMSVLARRRRR